MTTTESIAPADELEAIATRVDEALAAIETLEPEVRAKPLAVKLAIEEFHRAGLTAIVTKLKGDPRGKELLFELVDDPAVRAILTLHGIVRALPAEEPAPTGPLELVQIQLPDQRAVGMSSS